MSQADVRLSLPCTPVLPYARIKCERVVQISASVFYHHDDVLLVIGQDKRQGRHQSSSAHSEEMKAPDPYSWREEEKRMHGYLPIIKEWSM